MEKSDRQAEIMNSLKNYVPKDKDNKDFTNIDDCQSAVEVKYTEILEQVKKQGVLDKKTEADRFEELWGGPNGKLNQIKINDCKKSFVGKTEEELEVLLKQCHAKIKAAYKEMKKVAHEEFEAYMDNIIKTMNFMKAELKAICAVDMFTDFEEGDDDTSTTDDDNVTATVDMMGEVLIDSGADSVADTSL